MSTQEIEARVRDLKKIVAQQASLKETYDNYFFLARIGSNYMEYHFSWESFRDLAGPLEVGERSLPIVIISDAKPRQAPELSEAEKPTPHYQIRVSPTVDIMSLTNMWLELLVDNQASHGRYKGPFDWFVHNLGISADKLSQKSRSFLSL
jgi:hypothetical protein